MCSRFELNAPARQIGTRFLIPDPLPNLPEPVVRPTDPALVVTPGGPRVLRFGLTVSWEKRPIINARAETLARRPTFQPLLANRCLVPATAWIEWQDVGPRRKKPMWRLRPAEGGPFALAGLVRDDCFLLITTAAAAPIAFLHDRMPAVLAPRWEGTWLDPATSFTAAAPALEPYAGAIEATAA